MPYIERKRRDEIDAGGNPATKGELNYAVTMEAIRYLSGFPLSYTRISETIAALNDAAAELRRRLLDPYEEAKIAENGDVYPGWAGGKQ